MCFIRTRVFSLVMFNVIIISILCRDVKKTHDLYLPDYRFYHDLSSIYSTINKLHKDNSDILNISHTFKSREGKDIPVLHLHEPTTSRSHHGLNTTSMKQTVLLIFGIHSREYFPVESALQFLKNIASLYKTSNSAPNLGHFILLHFNVYVIPLLNPDGRKYTETTGNMCWRGTSTGVDLERNFEWGFGGAGSSSKKDDEEYRGDKAFSEPESAAVRRLSEIVGHIDCFVSFHSGIKHIYVPFADTSSREKKILPPYLTQNLNLAKHLSNSVSPKFQYGPVFKLNSYTMDGTMFDYMAAVRKVPYSLTIEMWGEGDNDNYKKGCFDLFNPKSEDLENSLLKLSPLYSALFHYLHSNRILVAKSTPQRVIASGRSSLYIYLIVGLILVLLSLLNKKYLPSVKGLFNGRRIVNLRNIGSNFYTEQSSFKKV